MVTGQCLLRQMGNSRRMDAHFKGSLKQAVIGVLPGRWELVTMNEASEGATLNALADRYYAEGDGTRKANSYLRAYEQRLEHRVDRCRSASWNWASHQGRRSCFGATTFLRRRSLASTSPSSPRAWLLRRACISSRVARMIPPCWISPLR